MKDNEKVSLLDWRFKLAIFFLILAFLILIIALILLSTAKFAERFNPLGNGFWALRQYGLKDLLFDWVSLDDWSVTEAFSSHPFLQVFIALLFLVFLLPIFFIMGSILLLRWWIKTRI